MAKIKKHLRNIGRLSFKQSYLNELFLQENLWLNKKENETTSITCLTKPEHPFSCITVA